MQYLVIDTNLEMALTDEYLARMAIWEQTWTETQVTIMMVIIMLMITLVTMGTLTTISIVMMTIFSQDNFHHDDNLSQKLPS